MKNVSYTQMRTELSTILDTLRKGGSVTITQRGKPDVVISGAIPSSCEQRCTGEYAGDVPAITPYTRRAERPSDKLLSPDAISHIRRIGDDVKAIRSAQDFSDTPEDIQCVTDKRTDFQKALDKTKIKHADIIRALEDK